MFLPEPLFDASFTTAALGCAAVAFGCWLLSVVTREYSWVDRLWSVVPALYIGWFASASGWAPRVVLMTVLATLWAARLTFNFARKGGYAKGGEDYRWAILRSRMSPAVYQVFNIFFIAGYQNLLLFMLSWPAWVALRAPQSALGAADIVSALLFLALLAGETIADQQQWNFHKQKKAGATLPEPFCTTGLFRYSRHPNFFCEFSQWWVLYAMGSLAAGSWLNLGLIGPVLLTLLFLGSTRFTESISLSKYPSYAQYQKRTSALLPLPPRG